MMNLDRIETIVEHHRQRPGATLPILHDIQHEYGYIPAEAIQLIATGLNLSRAEIHGVISFYADFRTTPPGKHIIQVCRGEACQAKGGQHLEAHAQQTLATEFHQTNADRSVSLEPVYCLGNCGCSPSVRIGNSVYGRVSPQRFDELVGSLDSTQPAGNHNSP